MTGIADTVASAAAVNGADRRVRSDPLDLLAMSFRCAESLEQLVKFGTGRLRLVAYSPYWRVSWTTSWQETKSTTLTRELSTIVKAIERAAVDLVEKLKEADCQAERARLQRLAEEEQRRREEDIRQIQQSAKDSQAHLHHIIRDWAEAANIERFFQGVYDRASDLPAEARELVLERLKLARDFIGTQNPLDFFLSWKTPDERYVSLSALSEAGEDNGPTRGKALDEASSAENVDDDV